MSTSIFGSNAMRASETQLVLPLLKPPLSIIESHCPDWAAFVQHVADHPAVCDALRATRTQGFRLDAEDTKYAVDYNGSAAVANANSFGNRFDSRLYESFVALLAARAAAKDARDEHDAIMVTRPPPTPPPEEEFVHDDDAGAGGAGGGEDGEYEEGEESYGQDAGAQEQQQQQQAAPRPRKTRAQRREEEKQRKEDQKRQYEVEQKEHIVACMEQKLGTAVSANAVRVTLRP